MLIAHVNQDPGIAPGKPKGAAVHDACMKAAFRALGCEVVEIVAKDAADVRAGLDALGSRVDLVYERYALGATAAASFAARTGTPLVLEVNSPLIDEARRHRGLEETALLASSERFVFTAAAHVMVVSNAVADYVARAGVERGRISVRANGVDCARFHPRDSGALRDELDIPRGSFVVGFHGRLRPWHGFDRLVRVFERVLAKDLDAHLLVVGEGEFDEHLARSPARPRYRRVGWVPHEDVAAYVACFDALPITYPADAPCYFSPLKLAEAMASGAVPLVPDLGDLPSLVEDGVTGLVHPAGDLDALVEHVERLIRRPPLRDELAARGVAAMRERSWESIAREVLERVQVNTAR